MIDPSQEPPPDHMQQIQDKGIHTSAGFETSIPAREGP